MIYKINKNGYHGTDFIKNPDILAIGCSVTAGCGLPYDLTWPHLVARELNQTVNVLAQPNGSVQRIFNNTVNYMKQFGLPKKILFLTPDLRRFWFPEIKEKRWLSSYNWDYSNKNFNFTENRKQKPLIYKDYFNVNRSFPLEAAVFSALTSLNTLELFSSLGIDYHFFSWDGETNYVYNKINNNFYITNNKEESEISYLLDHENCTDHLPSNEDQLFFWNLGFDYGNHPGMHAHIHYAERFLGRSLSKETIKESKITQRPL